MCSLLNTHKNDIQWDIIITVYCACITVRITYMKSVHFSNILSRGQLIIHIYIKNQSVYSNGMLTSGCLKLLHG